MDARELKVGEVVQINPEANDRFGGCLMIVSEEKAFGALGYVMVPHAEGPRQAYLRCEFKDMEALGATAEWLIGSAAENAA